MQIVHSDVDEKSEKVENSFQPAKQKQLELPKVTSQRPPIGHSKRLDNQEED